MLKEIAQCPGASTTSLAGFLHARPGGCAGSAWSVLAAPLKPAGRAPPAASRSSRARTTERPHSCGPAGSHGAKANTHGAEDGDSHCALLSHRLHTLSSALKSGRNRASWEGIRKYARNQAAGPALSPRLFEVFSFFFPGPFLSKKIFSFPTDLVRELVPPLDSRFSVCWACSLCHFLGSLSAAACLSSGPF